MSPDLYWIAVVLTTIVASSRLIRLWTNDDFPPVAALRNKFLDVAEDHFPAWAELGFCPWCCGFWITLPVILLGYWADVYGDPLMQPHTPWAFITWWIVMGTLAGSYLAAMLMARDGDSETDEMADTKGEVL